MFSDHFGRTPLRTPFGSQDSTLSCAIDISDGVDEEEQPVIDFNERVRQYIREHGRDADEVFASDIENHASGDSDGDLRDDPNTSDHDDLADIQDHDIPLDETVNDDLQNVRTLKGDGCNFV